jgi:hypothetical protein
MKSLLIGSVLLGASTVVQAQDLPNATYVVPAADDLPAPVTMPIGRVRFDLHAGTAALRYHLPQEMDGATPRSIEVQTLEAQPDGTLVGTQQNDTMEVTATCTTTDREAICAMTYRPSIVLDEDAAQMFLESRYRDSPDTQETFRRARETLMRQSIGLVRIHLR